MLVPLDTLHIFTYYTENRDLDRAEAQAVAAAAKVFIPQRVPVSRVRHITSTHRVRPSPDPLCC